MINDFFYKFDEILRSLTPIGPSMQSKNKAKGVLYRFIQLHRSRRPRACMHGRPPRDNNLVRFPIRRDERPRSIAPVCFPRLITIMGRFKVGAPFAGTAREREREHA